MAKYNEILVGRYNRFLQKLTQIKGTAPAAQLSGEIGATIALFNGAENRYLEGWHRYMVNAIVTAAAANTSGFRLRNPQGSNVIAVVETLVAEINNPAADTWSLAHDATNADLGTILVLTTRRLDPRGNQNPTLIASTQNTSPALPGNLALHAQMVMPPNTSLMFINFENQEIPILPGDAIQTQPLAVNTPHIVTVGWRERFLEESERT